jgi:hypothetical protein
MPIPENRSYQYITGDRPNNPQTFGERTLRAHLRDMCMWSHQEIDRAIHDADRNGEHRHVSHGLTTRIKSIY